MHCSAKATDWGAYIGLPYGNKGRGPDCFDCWGLVRWIAMQELGEEWPLYLDGYENAADRKEVAALAGEAAASWKAIGEAGAQPFDVLLIRFGRFACHCGIVASDGEMLHILRGINSTLERYKSPRWARRIEGAYRWQPQ